MYQSVIISFVLSKYLASWYCIYFYQSLEFALLYDWLVINNGNYHYLFWIWLRDASVIRKQFVRFSSFKCRPQGESMMNFTPWSVIRMQSAKLSTLKCLRLMKVFKNWSLICNQLRYPQPVYINYFLTVANIKMTQIMTITPKILETMVWQLSRRFKLQNLEWLVEN